MFQRRRILRRVLLLVVAMVGGGLAALIGATPASAHSTSVIGSAVCDNDAGNWVVTWVVHDDWPSTATLIKVVSTPTPVDGIQVGSQVPHGVDLTGTQRVPNGTASFATLAVRGEWSDDGYKEERDRSGTVQLGTNCVQNQPKPHASASSACDGSVTVTLTNDADATKAAAFTVTTGAGSKSYTVAPGGSLDVPVPPAHAGSIVVTSGNAQLLKTAWSAPRECAPLAVASKMDCTSLTLTLENPAGNHAVDATLTSGNNSQDVSVGNGESKSVTFQAAAGTTATVNFGAGNPVTVAWEQPASCLASPSAPPALPTTGSHLTPLIASGAGLLIVGAAVLFVLFRRRMSTESRTF